MSFTIIREKYGVTDAEQWCRDYIAQKNKEQPVFCSKTQVNTIKN